MRLSTLITPAVMLFCQVLCANEGHTAQDTGSEERITVTNGLLTVRYYPKNATFSALRGDKLFLKQARFEEIADTANVIAKIVNTRGELGAGRAIEAKFPSGRTFRLTLYNKLPFLDIGVSIHNVTGREIIVNKLVYATLPIDLARPTGELRVLGCDGLTPAHTDRTSYTFLTIADPQTSSGLVCGWLTQNRASGIVASKTDGDLVTVEPRAEYGRIRIPPGKTVEGETLVVGFFDNALAGLEQYADTIAKAHKIKLPEVPSGYCTWYSKPHGGASDEKHMAELADFCKENLTKFGFDTLQIDDKWQISRRDFTDHNPKGPYPSGMKPTADYITDAGMAAGIWFIPFGWDRKRQIFEDRRDWFVHREDGSVYSVHWAGDCLDMTHPEARKFLGEAIRRMTREWGYKYIKIDGLWTGLAAKILYPQPTYRSDGFGDAVFHDPSKTNIEAYRDGMKLVRRAAGEDVYILGCNIAQNMRTLGGSIGLVDGMRVGSDTGARWGGIMRGAYMGSRLYFFHGRVWHNDPDCLMLRDPLTIEQAQSWAGWIGITGQLNMVSEWLPGLPEDKLDAFKRSIPNHNLSSRPIDLFENDPAKIWHLKSGENEQRIDIVGLFNWSDKEPTSIDLDLAKLDLPENPTGSYIGFDFWANDFISPFAEKFKTDLPPSSCRIIALKPLLERPVLLSTSRHVTQGIVDIVKQTWSKKGTLTGKSEVVADDRYELRIFNPDKKWKFQSISVAKSDGNAGVRTELHRRAKEIRMAIISPENRTVSWKVSFKKD
ncbi:MAG: glycoside hydrolase family 36 protein [Planctomycetota bacterium]|jgi:hypothetical protein